jgi:hypothetical protein
VPEWAWDLFESNNSVENSARYQVKELQNAIEKLASMPASQRRLSLVARAVELASEYKSNRSINRPKRTVSLPAEHPDIFA